jgi:flagellar basal-body rod modification protein FlgD
MDIGGVSQSINSQASNSQAASNNDTMGKDGFLQLLVTQMQNQDPLDPMDSDEYASQLAQFNSVEQLINLNNGLEGLQSSQEMMRMEMTNSMATSLAGKEVRALSNQVYLEPGENVSVDYELNGAADQVEIRVLNASGTVVREDVLTGVNAGESTWLWDGTNNSGSPLPEGPYHIEINASNDGEKVKSRMFTEGLVQKVRFTDRGVMLAVDQIDIPIGDVESVKSAEI